MAPKDDSIIFTNEDVELTEEERTPRKLRAMEPDVTVVVGGVEFYHYKVILCSGCDFFDTMLSANMKESQESRIEFPYKDPNEWLDIYAFFDSPPLCANPPEITAENALTYISWFHYLGMNDLVEKCDYVYAGAISTPKTMEEFEIDWVSVKGLPCPYTKNKMLDFLFNLFAAIQNTGNYKYHPRVQRNALGGMCEGHATKLKSMILDEAGGEEIWRIVKSEMHIPMAVGHLTRREIAENPLFVHLLQSCHKPL